MTVLRNLSSASFWSMVTVNWLWALLSSACTTCNLWAVKLKHFSNTWCNDKCSICTSRAAAQFDLCGLWTNTSHIHFGICIRHHTGCPAFFLCKILLVSLNCLHQGHCNGHVGSLLWHTDLKYLWTCVSNSVLINHSMHWAFLCKFIATQCKRTQVNNYMLQCTPTNYQELGKEFKPLLESLMLICCSVHGWSLNVAWTLYIW
jgi:hypothetical protein